MRSILSIALAAVMMLTVMTGCGNRRKNDVTTTTPPVAATQAPAATDIPAATTKPENAGSAVGDAVDRVENGTNDIVNGVENAVDDVLGDEGAINGDMNDGTVTDNSAVEPRNTTAAR